MSYAVAFVAFIAVLLFVLMTSAVVNAGRRAAEIRRQRREAQEEMKTYTAERRRE